MDTPENPITEPPATNQSKAGDATATINGSTGNNKFQAAIAAWRNINLTTLIPQLDSAASDLVAHQRDSLVERKELAQKTKDFRKLDDAGKLVEIKTLLKSYQTYIDLISNQGKAIEKAFLSVYGPLAEAPDPYPLLDASIDSLVVAEETVPKITEENAQLQKSISRLTTQLEEAEKRLDQERSARKEVENSKDEKIKAVESSWTAVLSEKEDNWAAKEKTLEEKVENQDRLLKEFKANLEVAQRMSRGEGDNDVQERGATTAELDIVSSELDRANQRLAQVEARNEQLRVELAQVASGQGSAKASTAVEDDPAYLRLQSENSSLLRRLESARFEKDADKRKVASDLRTLERDVKNLKQDNDSLRNKVSQYSDYDNLKKELEVLKSIEFATGDDDDEVDNGPAMPSIEDRDGTKKSESLEQLLLARNKKLSNELTLLRVSHQDLQSRLQTLQQDLADTTSELEQSRSLAATLESDLEKIQQEATNAFGSSAMSVAGTYTSRYPRRGRAASPTSSIISGYTSGPREDSAGMPVMGAGSGMLPMITAQRDRFKRKITDLENELQKEHQTVSSLRSEVASLQKDNLNLYEKTRYMSSGYSRNAQPAVINIANDQSTSSGMSMAVDARYRPAYEQSLNPFNAFRGRESARMFRGMSRIERVVYRGAKLVLATRTSRNLFAAYCLTLHVLVLLSLYWLSSGAVGTVYHAGPLAAAALREEGGHVEGAMDMTEARDGG